MKNYEFELLIMDMCYEKKIKDAETLKNFSDDLHQSLELAIEDYANDNEFGDDYEPNY